LGLDQDWEIWHDCREEFGDKDLWLSPKNSPLKITTKDLPLALMIRLAKAAETMYQGRRLRAQAPQPFHPHSSMPSQAHRSSASAEPSGQEPIRVHPVPSSSNETVQELARTRPREEERQEVEWSYEEVKRLQIRNTVPQRRICGKDIRKEELFNARIRNRTKWTQVARALGYNERQVTEMKAGQALKKYFEEEFGDMSEMDLERHLYGETASISISSSNSSSQPLPKKARTAVAIEPAQGLNRRAVSPGHDYSSVEELAKIPRKGQEPLRASSFDSKKIKAEVSEQGTCPPAPLDSRSRESSDLGRPTSVPSKPPPTAGNSATPRDPRSGAPQPRDPRQPKDPRGPPSTAPAAAGKTHPPSPKGSAAVPSSTVTTGDRKKRGIMMCQGGAYLCCVQFTEFKGDCGSLLGLLGQPLPPHENKAAVAPIDIQDLLPYDVLKDKESALREMPWAHIMGEPGWETGCLEQLVKFLAVAS